MLHLLDQGLLGHLLQAGIQGELQAQVIAIEGASCKACGQGGAIGASQHAQRRLIALEIPVATLLEPSLGNPLEIQKADHIGKETPLGIDAMGVGLQIQAADPEGPHPTGGFRVKLGGQFDPAALARQGRHQGALWHRQDARQFGGHVLGGTNLQGGIAWKVEIAGMGPEGEALLIQGHQAAVAVNDRAAFADRINRLGLDRAGPGFEVATLHQLEPSEPDAKAAQSGAENQIHRDKPPCRHWLEGQNSMTLPRTLGRTGPTTGASGWCGRSGRHSVADQ